MQTTTPETDAFTTSFTSIDDPEGNKRWVPSEFARVIERERDEARNKMADALQEVDLRTLDFERMKQERDEAIKRYEEISRIFDGADEEEWKSCTTLGETVARILRERDDARKV